MIPTIAKLVVLTVLGSALFGCASDVIKEPAQFFPYQGPVIEITQTFTTYLPTGGYNEIVAGSRWREVGSVAQGRVYRSMGDLLTIKGANTHEAYLIIADNKMMSYYLPGDKAVAPLQTPVGVSFKLAPNK